MRANKKARREAAAIAEAFPLHPFQDLDNPEVHRQASAYMRMRHKEVNDMPAVPGESEYVVRSRKIPDRRLTFPDMRLWQRLRRHAEKSRLQNPESLYEGQIVPQVAGHLALEQVMPEVSPVGAISPEIEL
jgi:hypothetical protein